MEPDGWLRSPKGARVLLRPLALALAGLAVGLAAALVALSVVEWLAPDASDVTRIAVGYLVSVTATAAAIVAILRVARQRGDRK